MKLVFTFFVLCLSITGITQPTFLDSTFGTDGKITENSSVPYKYEIDNALQPDGKTILLAEAYYNLVNRIYYQKPDHSVTTY